jgi:chromate reductase, NAD(P)H dehydrogenase (quinone)
MTREEPTPPRPDAGSPLRIVTLCGSLRKGSFNRALLRAAGELAPEGLSLEEGPDLGGLPLYNADLDGEASPEPVRALRRVLREADGMILASPEYNYGIPGVVKNALDWASRPAKDSPLSGLPTLLLGASGGGSGTMRGQLQVRQCFVFTATPVLPKPEFYLPRAPEKFEEGRLVHEATREHLARTLEAFERWARRRGEERGGG